MDANIIIYSALFIAGIAALCMLSLYAHELISTRRRAYKLIEEALQDRILVERESQLNEDGRTRIDQRISRSGNTAEEVLSAFSEREEPMTGKEVSEICGYSYSYTLKCLRELEDNGRVRRVNTENEIPFYFEANN